MTPKQVQTLARLLAVVAFLIWAVYSARAAPPQDYIARLLYPTATPGPLPLLPIYPVKKPVVPVKNPVVKPNPAPKPVVMVKVPTVAQQDANAAKMVAWLRERLWWREVNGYNRGPGIDEAVRANHGTLGEEYCGDTQAAANRACGLTVPKASNGSYNWFLDTKRLVLKGRVGSFDLARVGYKVGIFNVRKGRIAHITCIAEPPITGQNRNAPAQGAFCIAGNEGSGKNAGMKRTWYAKVNMYALSNYNY